MKNELPHLLKARTEGHPALHRLGVVLPITTASPRLGECLAALAAALDKAVKQGHQADLYVVIDGRNADSAAIASTFAVHLVTADFSDLASARAIGARAALGGGATWLAFTESSALVADSWLVEQISNDAELLLGDVEITNGFMSQDLAVAPSAWQEMSAVASSVSAANFSNLGMSRSAFELAAHLGGSQLRLDATLLDQLSTLKIATHRCCKPLVYARMQPVDEVAVSADTLFKSAGPMIARNFECQPSNALTHRAALGRQVAPLATA